MKKLGLVSCLLGIGLALGSGVVIGRATKPSCTNILGTENVLEEPATSRIFRIREENVDGDTIKENVMSFLGYDYLVEDADSLGRPIIRYEIRPAEITLSYTLGF